jgi:hypothetical protein
VRASQGRLSLRFSEALDRGSVDAGAFAVKAWSLKRSANYGSQHLNERSWKVASASLAADGCTVVLEIPELAATPCYEVLMKVRGADGSVVERSLHGTIHRLN